MGHDSTNFLETKSKTDVIEFLKTLRYQKVDADTLFYYNDENFEHVTGVTATIRIGEDRKIEVGLRTNIIRSKVDADLHNNTIRQLRKRFGGGFQSDDGTNRYMPHFNSERTKAEGGCYLAYLNFRNNFVLVFVYLDRVKPQDTTSCPLTGIPFIDQTNPDIISNNLMLPFLIAISEEYFKSTYSALLKYSEKKDSVLKSARFFSEDLVRVSEGTMKLEEAATKSMSFQNIGKISTYFKELDKRYNIHGTLCKPYRRRKETLYDAVDRIFNQRHALIHQSIITTTYTSDNATKDAQDIKAAITRVYEMLIAENKWATYDS